VNASPYVPQGHYFVFMFTIDFAFMNRYVDGIPNTRRWQSTE
jgi:hypothetical protein